MNYTNYLTHMIPRDALLNSLLYLSGGNSHSIVSTYVADSFTDS